MPDNLESPEYTGRAAVVLAADANVLARPGRVQTVGQLAQEYGWTDIDGRQLPPFQMEALRKKRKADRVRLPPSEGGNVPCPLFARRGLPLRRAALRRRFLSACKILGMARLRTLTIHHGRHTYISHALAGGRTLAEVRVAAGHSSLLTTSVYLHVAVDDDGEVGSLFEFQRALR